MNGRSSGRTRRKVTSMGASKLLMFAAIEGGGWMVLTSFIIKTDWRTDTSVMLLLLLFQRTS